MATWIILFTLLILSISAFLYSKHLYNTQSLPLGKVISADTKSWKINNAPLYDHHYKLIGKPDYIIYKEGSIIPVEIKSSKLTMHKPYTSHLIQLIAYCYLIEQTYSFTPPYGELHYPNKQFKIFYHLKNKKFLLDTLQLIQRKKKEKTINRNHNNLAKCSHCGYRSICDQSLV